MNLSAKTVIAGAILGHVVLTTILTTAFFDVEKSVSSQFFANLTKSPFAGARPMLLLAGIPAVWLIKRFA
jgi:hypothetical protein